MPSPGLRNGRVLPRNPHNLKVGETCWLVVQGEDKDLANCHEAVVESVARRRALL